MANLKSVRKNADPVMLDIGGRVRQLKFDMNAFGELENLYGSVDAAMNAMQTGSMKSLTTILWAALIHEEAVLDEVTGEPIRYNISRYQVGSWVSPHDFVVITETLNKLMGEDMPPQDEEQAKKVAKKPNPNLPQ